MALEQYFVVEVMFCPNEIYNIVPWGSQDQCGWTMNYGHNMQIFLQSTCGPHTDLWEINLEFSGQFMYHRCIKLLESESLCNVMN